jgi:hypothetical protein
MADLKGMLNSSPAGQKGDPHLAPGSVYNLLVLLSQGIKIHTRKTIKIGIKYHPLTQSR